MARGSRILEISVILGIAVRFLLSLGALQADTGVESARLGGVPRSWFARRVAPSREFIFYPRNLSFDGRVRSKIGRFLPKCCAAKSAGHEHIGSRDEAGHRYE